ncbi:hypothetical protein Pa4123_71130 [Phytohabitans aurantiacus]|uniref:Xylulose 5-phosphate/Fructose 6-phosphate phosphoketolase C-terminal domain-containing protein n=1 Tax=Phytohabitans aurantiacus TaxID=3016789 RepID=A0ABQ5R8E0_9ACTN|nr:hypothetical protein Pa4123_71130 [Phytohabitans aurantiacus]
MARDLSTIDVIDRVPGLGARAAHLRQAMVDARQQCRDHTRRYGEDAPQVTEWRWIREEAKTTP